MMELSRETLLLDGSAVNCGYIHEGADAPTVCPCCAHPQAYFERMTVNY